MKSALRSALLFVALTSGCTSGDPTDGAAGEQGGGAGSGGQGGTVVAKGGGGAVLAGKDGGVGRAGDASTSDRKDAGQSPSIDATQDKTPSFDAAHSTFATGLYYDNVVTLTAEVVANVRAISALADGRKDDTFIKIGDSITSGGADNPFACFARASAQTIDLAGRTTLSPTVFYFDQTILLGGRSGPTATGTSWDRNTFSAAAGMGAAWPLRPAADPPWNGALPLEKELGEVAARFAIWMLGTNDTCSTPTPYKGAILYRDYGNQIVKVIEYLSSRGVVPIITYIPPVLACGDLSHWETLPMVTIARAVSIAKRVPTVDAYTEMEAIGASAFWDGLHPANLAAGGCIFTAAGLAYGVNIRNLRTLEVLDKLRRVVTSNVDRIDPDPPVVVGKGTAIEPIEIPGLPFGFASPIQTTGSGAIDDYTSCGGPSGQTGKEVVYRLVLDARTPVRAIGLPGECATADKCAEGLDVAVAIFKDDLKAKSCVTAGTTVAQKTLEPGIYYVVLDAPAGSSQPKTAILAAHACMAGDTRCL